MSMTTQNFLKGGAVVSTVKGDADPTKNQGSSGPESLKADTVASATGTQVDRGAASTQSPAGLQAQVVGGASGSESGPNTVHGSGAAGTVRPAYNDSNR